MAFDWADYLTLAKELATRDDEAAQRSAMSRAYYAAFHSARSFLRQEGVSISNPGLGEHKSVWDAFQNSRDDQRIQIGQRGERLRLFRNRADYDNRLPNLTLFVKTTLITSEQVISGGKSLRSNPSEEPL